MSERWRNVWSVIPKWQLLVLSTVSSSSRKETCLRFHPTTITEVKQFSKSSFHIRSARLQSLGISFWGVLFPRHPTFLHFSSQSDLEIRAWVWPSGPEVKAYLLYVRKENKIDQWVEQRWGRWASTALASFWSTHTCQLHSAFTSLDAVRSLFFFCHAHERGSTSCCS